MFAEIILISKYLDIFHLHICLLQSCHQFTFLCHHFTPEERLSFDNFSRILLFTFRAALQTFSSHQRWPTPIEAEMKNLRTGWIWDFPNHLNLLTFVTLSHGLKFWRILQRVLVSFVNSRTWREYEKPWEAVIHWSKKEALRLRQNRT